MTTANSIKKGDIAGMVSLRSDVLKRAKSILSSSQDLRQILENDSWRRDSGILYAIVHNQNADFDTLLAIAKNQNADKYTLMQIMDREGERGDKDIDLISAVAAHQNTSKAVLSFISTKFPENADVLIAIASNLSDVIDFQERKSAFDTLAELKRDNEQVDVKILDIIIPVLAVNQEIFKSFMQSKLATLEMSQFVSKQEKYIDIISAVAAHQNTSKAVLSFISTKFPENADVLIAIASNLSDVIDFQKRKSAFDTLAELKRDNEQVNVKILDIIIPILAVNQEIFKSFMQSKLATLEMLQFVSKQERCNEQVFLLIVEHFDANQALQQLIENNRTNAALLLAIAGHGTIDFNIFNALITNTDSSNINQLLMAIAKNKNADLDVLKVIVKQYAKSPDVLIKIFENEHVFPNRVSVDIELLKLIIDNKSCDEAILLRIISQVDIPYLHGNKLIGMIIKHSCATKRVLTSMLNRVVGVTDLEIIKLIKSNQYVDDEVLSMLIHRCCYRQELLKASVQDPHIKTHTLLEAIRYAKTEDVFKIIIEHQSANKEVLLNIVKHIRNSESCDVNQIFRLIMASDKIDPEISAEIKQHPKCSQDIQELIDEKQKESFKVSK